LHLTPAQKFQIGKRASEHGVTSALHYYKKNFPDLPLKETSVRRFKGSYRDALRQKTHDDTQDELEELPTKKMGRPLLLGDEIDRQVKEYLKYLREQGSAFNTVIAVATAEGVVRSVDANLLACNGGGIHLTKAWARSLLNCMSMVKRRISSKAKVDIENFVDLYKRRISAGCKECDIDGRNSTSPGNKLGPNSDSVCTHFIMDYGARRS